MRLLYLTFLAETNSYRQIKMLTCPIAMGFPLFVLSFGIFIGYITKDMIIGVGTDFGEILYLLTLVI